MHNAFITYLKTFLLFVGIICNVYTAGFVIGAGGVLESDSTGLVSFLRLNTGKKCSLDVSLPWPQSRASGSHNKEIVNPFSSLISILKDLASNC
jgi:hypothetical protein